MTLRGITLWRSEQAWGVFVLYVLLALQATSNFFENWERSLHHMVSTSAAVHTPPTPTHVPLPNTTPEPAWGKGVAFTATVLTGLYIAFAVPNLSIGLSCVISLALVTGLLVLELWTFSTLNLWLELVFPAILLGLSFMGQLLHRLLVTRPTSTPVQPSFDQTDRMMGLALQGQGQLDMAFERFQRVPMNATTANDLYWLAMDYERQHHWDKAKTVYATICAFDANYEDAKQRLDNATSLTVVHRGTSPEKSASGHTLIQKTTGKALGRYRIETQLGQGAMGTVFLGKDPNIGRQVALKTMILSQAFEGFELADARHRFFREAKAAGCLQHPNIVTIFDVGEEHDLAYITMEYVAGQHLQSHCKPGQLMPVPRVVSIIARVAQALAYAHQQKVIHRDIKPSNVMYDLITDTVKVTDFGIAHITDGKKTKTGVVLGSPSYMSPEQLAGLTVDGRSDLYALGTTLFQLLTGTLPFKATTLAELMHKIATEPAPDIRQFRPELAEDLARIVARLLEKLPENRYQDGEKLASDLSLFTGRVQSRVSPVLVTSRPPKQPMTAMPIDIDLEL